MVNVGTATVAAEAAITLGVALMPAYEAGGQLIGVKAEFWIPGGVATLNQAPDFIRGFRAAYGEFAAGIPQSPAGMAGAVAGSIYLSIKNW
jgi:hypothetical protein